MSDSDHFPDLAEKLRVIRARLRARVEHVAPEIPEFHVPAFDSEGPNDAPGASATAPQRPATSSILPDPIPSALADAIGTVNPRAPGLANEIIQSLKRNLLRITEWQLRPQREFNRAVLDSLERITSALQAVENNGESQGRRLAQNDRSLRDAIENLNQVLRQTLEQRDKGLQDISLELNALCGQLTDQRWSYEGALMRHANAVEELKNELRALTQELHTVRQRVAAQAKVPAARPAAETPAPAVGAGNGAALAMDYLELERKFRGTEEEVRQRQGFYLPFFRGCRQVLDIACGRGEFLELMRNAGVAARGVDLDADMVGCCLEKGLDAVQSDAFAYLESVPDGSLDGIFSSQFVEHLEPAGYLRLIERCHAKLASGGVLALETQNPECLAIFSQSFFLDPTHVRPIPPAQLRFALIEAGFERVSSHSLSPASDSLPLVPQLPEGSIEPSALKAYNVAVAKFNETFFGGMDYAVIGYRPAAKS